MYVFFFKFFSHLGYYRILSRFPVLYRRSFLVIYFKYSSVYTSIPNSQSISPSPYLTSLVKFILQVCESGSVL